MNSKREIVTSKLSNRIIVTTRISAKKEERGPLAKSRPHSLTHWRLSSTETLKWNGHWRRWNCISLRAWKGNLFFVSFQHFNILL